MRENDVKHDLGHWKHEALKCAGQFNMPFKVVKTDYSGEYVTCPVSQKTTCEVVWSTDDPEPEPEKTPAQLEMAERIAKLQAEIERMKQGSAK